MGVAMTKWDRLLAAVDIGAPVIGLVCLAAVVLALLPDKAGVADAAAGPTATRPGEPA